ncbi:hypothetical protein [Erwinia sp. S38]|uniref:hypothetical protein n=1 Tax=Erwinia sp. S38 TaxID=2769338 RepID=UPI00190B7C7C|nr:hypothetical protein [Erwinia sp. S38]MBK0000109.1 hypothetical protein [Erwinia sp. S38]
MRNRQRLAKWFLIITCLSLAICLVQRVVYLHHFFHPVDYLTTTSLVADTGKDVSESQLGPSPCQLSGCSLLNAQPLFFDGALPAVILFLALLQLFIELRHLAFRDEPVRAPPLRIHLINCVFRE